MKVYSVSEVVNYISDYLELGLGSIAIQGEVADYKVNQGRLVFFELKDDNSRILCFGLTHEISKVLKNGMEIKILGLPKLFKKSGKLHIKVQEIELIGEGALQKAFEKLKAKLFKEGLFEEQYKKILPRFPQNIGLITSRDAAAYKDVLIRLNERWGGLVIKFIHTGVQGLGTISQIVKSIEYFNSYEPVDVLILTRGGGSLEDLQSFNDERVVRAVFASKIPIVVGVGHERDITLAELAADKRASTPTNAAEIVVPHKKDIRFQIEQIERILIENFERNIADKQKVISLIIDKVEIWLNRIQDKLARQIELLQTLSPQATLIRGYSISFKDGKVLKSASEVNTGEIVKTRLSKGEFESEVINNN